MQNSKTKKYSIHGKRILIFVSVFIVLFTYASSQTINSSRFSLSVRAGLNLSQIFGNRGFNHFGFSGGPQFGWQFSSRMSFNPEVLYNMKGAAKWANVDMGDYESVFLDLDYIEIPLLFNYYLGKRAKFSIEFGPSIGFLVRRQVYQNGYPVTGYTSQFNVYDISLAAGVNYYMAKGFSLNFRFMNSIVPIVPTSGQSTWGLATLSIGQLNSVMSFSLQYKFNFQKKETVPNDSIKVKTKPVKIKKQKGNIIDEEE